MKKLTVNLPKREYDILIGSNLLNSAGEKIKALSPKAQKCVVVTDENVAPLYSATVCDSLKKAGLSVHLITLPAGEATKSLEKLSCLYNEALDFKITRTDVAVALGGGVIGDLTGFFAATVLRGIDFYQIPTTLLAQVDSSVGGKVAVNVPAGKNLVGAFYQPKLVIIDTDTLKSLSDDIFSDGMAEVIKYGFIKDENLLSLLEKCENRSGVLSCIDEIIYTCCDIKRKVVENDELDTGERMILNFGHTLGHVIEKQYNFDTYTHGKAVGYGMVLAACLGEKLGISEKALAERVKNVLSSFGLPTYIPLDKNKITDTLALDKKSSGKTISFVFIKDAGICEIYKISAKELAEKVNEII